MKVKDLIESGIFEEVNISEHIDKEITTPFCCDLLSIAMSKAPAGACWVTIMGNINTIAVASLADVAVIVLAEGITMDSVALEKAREQQITVLASKNSVFDSALSVYQLIHA